MKDQGSGRYKNNFPDQLMTNYTNYMFMTRNEQIYYHYSLIENLMILSAVYVGGLYR